jgi:hypothetical protein
VVSFISAYLIGYPDAPTSVYGAQEASDHLGGKRSTSLIFNEVLTICSNFFFVWFLRMCTACYDAPRARGYVFRQSPCLKA